MKYTKLRTCSLSLSLCILLSGCSILPKEEAAKSLTITKNIEGVEYQMDLVRKGDVTQETTVNCMYEQTKESSLSFTVDDRLVDDVYVKKGDTVSHGMLLASLHTSNLEEDIANTEYEINKYNLLIAQTTALMEFDKTARREKRDREYYVTMEYAALQQYDKETESILYNYTTQIEDLTDDLSLAQMKLEALQKEKDESLLYADMSGTVSYIKQNLVGSLSTSSEAVITIIDGTDCVFSCDDLTYASYFKEGTPITIETGFGKVSTEYEAVPLNIGSWSEKMQFQLRTPDPELEIGTTGIIHLILEERKDVLNISKAALHSANDKYYVYKLDENNVRTQVFISIGLIGTKFVEVTDGLAEGDYVIIE